MNSTTAACGHSVWAVGAPGSEARAECERNPCDVCQQTVMPLGFLREYDGAAERFARTGNLPDAMGSPGAIDWINNDPEAFQERVREFRYAHAMEKLNLAE